MAVPLAVTGEVVGVLEVCAEQAGAFWPGDMKFFEAVAAQLGLAVKNWKSEASAEKKIDATHVSAGKLVEVARALEWNTPFFAGHSERVAWVAGQLGHAAGIRGNAARLLETAALVHDIGMMGIPDTILYSKGKLDDEERSIVQLHTVFGERMAYLLPDGDEIAPIVAAHHEFLDGSGYPEGLKGDEIPRLAQVIAVADVYDALTSDRPYRAAFVFTEALQQMQLKSACFDPDLLAALVARAPELEQALSERARFMPGAARES